MTREEHVERFGHYPTEFFVADRGAGKTAKLIKLIVEGIKLGEPCLYVAFNRDQAIDAIKRLEVYGVPTAIALDHVCTVHDHLTTVVARVCARWNKAPRVKLLVIDQGDMSGRAFNHVVREVAAIRSIVSLTGTVFAE